MLKTINIVWATGSEGYHIERALRDFSEQEVLGALAEQVQNAKMTSIHGQVEPDTIIAPLHSP